MEMGFGRHPGMTFSGKMELLAKDMLMDVANQPQQTTW